MHEFHIKTIGIVAGIMTTVSFIPQITKILKTGHTRDISLYMYAILETGLFLWLVYGIFIERLPIILANSVAFIFCGFILVVKIKNRRGE